MTDTSSFWNRLAVIIELLAAAPAQNLGRTAVVKLLYLLQAVRDVPLGYNFRLHTYGPFDSDVLDDLGYGQSLHALASRVVSRSHGYRYDLRCGTKANDLKGRGSAFVAKHREDIDWVLASFGELSASELELLSTIVYADREMRRRQTSPEEIALVVHRIKQHFSEDVIKTKVQQLHRRGLLQSLATTSNG